MSMFDNIKAKAEELLGDGSKVEELSDQVLDTVADKVNDATGGKHADHVETARAAIDDRIGE